MRSLITATVVATALCACGTSNQSGSSLADATDNSGAAASYSSTLNWSVSYEGATATGTMTPDANGIATVTVSGMPTGQDGSMDVTVLNGSQVVYRATISDLTVGQSGLVRRVSLASASSYSADDSSASDASSQYCGNEFFNNNENSNNFNDFNNEFNNNDFNNEFNNNEFNNNNNEFNNGRFGNEFGNNGFFNGFNNTTPPAQGSTGTTGTVVTGTTGTGNTGGAIAPKSGNGSLQLIMVVPR